MGDASNDQENVGVEVHPPTPPRSARATRSKARAARSSSAKKHATASASKDSSRAGKRHRDDGATPLASRENGIVRSSSVGTPSAQQPSTAAGSDAVGASEKVAATDGARIAKRGRIATATRPALSKFGRAVRIPSAGGAPPGGLSPVAEGTGDIGEDGSSEGGTANGLNLDYIKNWQPGRRSSTGSGSGTSAKKPPVAVTPAARESSSGNQSDDSDEPSPISFKPRTQAMLPSTGQPVTAPRTPAAASAAQPSSSTKPIDTKDIDYLLNWNPSRKPTPKSSSSSAGAGATTPAPAGAPTEEPGTVAGPSGVDSPVVTFKPRSRRTRSSSRHADKSGDQDKRKDKGDGGEADAGAGGGSSKPEAEAGNAAPGDSPEISFKPRRGGRSTRSSSRASKSSRSGTPSGGTAKKARTSRDAGEDVTVASGVGAAPPTPKTEATERPSTSRHGSSSSHASKLPRIKVKGQKYQVLKQVGKGGGGSVFKVMSSDCTILALKRMKMPGIRPKEIEPYKNEIELMERMRGKDNIIQLIDSEINYKEKAAYMLMELGEIDLKEMIEQQHKATRARWVAQGGEAAGAGEGESLCDENWLRFVWQQMLQAVGTVHEERIIHSDIKPANFVFVQGRLKVIDFGIAKGIVASDTTNVLSTEIKGTLNYLSPEALRPVEGGASDAKYAMRRAADIWSLGCMLYEMVYGRPPFAHLSQLQKIHALGDRTTKINFPPLNNTALHSLIRTCLQYDPSARMTIVPDSSGKPTLLSHEFLCPRVAPAVARDGSIADDELEDSETGNVTLSRAQLAALVKQLSRYDVGSSIAKVPGGADTVAAELAKQMACGTGEGAAGGAGGGAAAPQGGAVDVTAAIVAAGGSVSTASAAPKRALRLPPPPAEVKRSALPSSLQQEIKAAQGRLRPVAERAAAEASTAPPKPAPGGSGASGGASLEALLRRGLDSRFAGARGNSDETWGTGGDDFTFST